MDTSSVLKILVCFEVGQQPRQVDKQFSASGSGIAQPKDTNKASAGFRQVQQETSTESGMWAFPVLGWQIRKRWCSVFGEFGKVMLEPLGNVGFRNFYGFHIDSRQTAKTPRINPVGN